MQWAKASEALQAADRQKDEFMAMLGHELRNPLAILSTTASYLQLSKGQDPDLTYAEGVDLMSVQLKHLGRMVDDLLEVSRIRHGKVRLHRQIIDFGKLLEETVAAAKAMLEDRTRFIEIVTSPISVLINGDITRLSQVVMNLLSNAFKYTQEGGHIHVSLECEGNQAVLFVKDDGIGIPSDETEAIFEVFVQGETSIDRP